MKKLIQENGPSRIWVQAWQEEGTGQAEPMDPELMTDLDDWTGQLFNYYFLSHFSSDSEGQLDVNHARFSLLQQHLSDFFQSGELTGLHRSLIGSLSEYFQADDSMHWFSVVWDQFSLEDYHGKAIGFYLSRQKQHFFSTGTQAMAVLQGMPLNKPEFACLIVPGQQEDFKLFLSESGSQPGNWSKLLFPFFQHRDDAFHATQFFKMCKSFSEDVLAREYQQPREKQVEFLADSVAYASEKKVLDVAAFKQEVIRDPAVVDAFEDYQTRYGEQKAWNPPDQFAVSENVQKQAGRFVRSIIKLDKNFHIYVHGNKDRIERGYDQDRRMHYYTLFFEAES